MMPALITKFYSDLAGTGLLDSTLKYDLGRSTTGDSSGFDNIAPYERLVLSFDAKSDENRKDDRKWFFRPRL